MLGEKLTYWMNTQRSLVFTTSVILATVLAITIFGEAYGLGLVSTSMVKTLGKTLALCLAALALDLLWGYCGILSLGHFAFFGLGGYMIGMWLMYDRTKDIVINASLTEPIPLTALEIEEAIGTQIFGVVGGSEIPGIWWFADYFWVQLALVILVPGVIAFVFGLLAFRSRVTGVYLSILSQALTLAICLYLFQNDNGLRGNNGLSGLQNIPGFDHLSQAFISLWFFWASAFFLIIGYVGCKFLVGKKFGNVIRAIRDDENRIRFLGYNVERYKLFVFVYTAVICSIAGALYYPQAGIVNPTELAPIASIYLAVWVSIGGRGRLYGAIIGAAFVSLLSSFFTGGQLPDIKIGSFTFKWVDWWLVILGLSFILVTLFAPKGIGGVFDRFQNRRLEP